jgi:hypothetical protein
MWRAGGEAERTKDLQAVERQKYKPGDNADLFLTRQILIRSRPWTSPIMTTYQKFGSCRRDRPESTESFH